MCLFTACSFNHQFLKPEKIPAQAKRGKIGGANGDTTVIHFDGPNHQPLFTTVANIPIPAEYTIESITFPSTSANNINGWLIKPKGTKADITLLFLHGNGGNVLTEYPAAAAFAKRGMQVFIIDYSGYGFSTGTPTWKNVWNDAGAALQYLHKRADVKGTLLAIYGQSYGAYTAIGLAQKYQHLISGVVAEGAPTSRKDIAVYQTHTGVMARILVKEKHSAIKAIKKLHKPVLIIHSDEDKTVPFSMGEALFKEANEPKTFYRIHQCHICGPTFYADSIAWYIRQIVKP
jgi:dipeptidyl aminopeptidase/acylaminoacyl peptidase